MEAGRIAEVALCLLKDFYLHNSELRDNYPTGSHDSVLPDVEQIKIK